MGISNTSLLFFGWDHLGLDDECPVVSLLLKEDEYEEGEYEFDDFIAEELGIQKPFGEGLSEEENDKRYKAKVEAIKSYPVEEILYCSYDYGIYTLAVRGTEIRALRGDLTVIDPEGLKVPLDKIEEAKKWFEYHNLEWQEPKWLLSNING